jgi:hypothetical protein
MRRNQSVSCSFCGKTPAEVGRVIAGPNVNICDQCVDLCQGICAGEREKSSATVDGPLLEGVLFVRWKDGTTEEIRGLDLYLDDWGPIRRFSHFTRTQFGSEPARIVLRASVPDLMTAVSDWARIAFNAVVGSEPVSEPDRLEPGT